MQSKKVENLNMLYNKVAIIGASITLASLFSGCTKDDHGQDFQGEEQQIIKDLAAVYNQAAGNFTQLYDEKLSDDDRCAKYDEILANEKDALASARSSDVADDILANRLMVLRKNKNGDYDVADVVDDQLAKAIVAEDVAREKVAKEIERHQCRRAF